MQCLDFVKFFGRCGKSKPKDAAERVVNKLRRHACELKDKGLDENSTRGRPPKMAKITDLKKLYPDWK